MSQLSRNIGSADRLVHSKSARHRGLDIAGRFDHQFSFTLSSNSTVEIEECL